jgi:cystathionine beta-lyase/cystathionine gamma-synthase
MRLATRAVHAGHEPDQTTGAVTPPIYTSSTYAQIGIGKTKGYEYSRSQNPTRERLERAIADLEGGKYGLAFSSGMAAISAVAGLLKKDEHVIICNDVYGGTYRLFNKVLLNYGIKFGKADANSEASVVKSIIRGKTKMIWLESPTNPLMKVLDIKKVAGVAKEHELVLVVDNTFASPCLQNPLMLGATIVVHSTTKYISGHSDLIGGGLVTSNHEIYDRLKFLQNAVGAIPSPFDCYLTLRGIRTIYLRMTQHSKNASAIADHLASEKLVSSVYYPFLKSSPYYAIAKKQMKLGGGMLSFRVKGGFRIAERFLKSLKIFTLAESLGGVESLVDHPYRMTHASMTKDERKSLGITDDLIRLSVGIEDGLDLLEDIRNAIRFSSS